MAPDFRIHSKGIFLPPREKPAAGERLQRYEQLKVSVHALRSQLRPRSAPGNLPVGCLSLTSCAGDENMSPGSACCNGMSSLNSAKSGGCSLKETASTRMFRLQSELQHQEEFAKLRDRLSEKMKKIEQLTVENGKQKKKLESRIHYFDKKCRALETRLAEETARVQQELAAQEKAQALRRDEQEETHRRTVVGLRDGYDASIAGLEEKHRSYRAKTEMTLQELSTSSAFLRDKVLSLEEELAAVCIKAEEDTARHRQEEKDWNNKLQRITKTQEDQVDSLRKALEKDKETWEQEKRQDEARRAADMQAYRLQKANEIDTIAERVRLALETKDTIILQLKSELAKLHRHLDKTTQTYQEQASDLLHNI